VPPAGSDRVLNPPLLAGAFRVLDRDGCANRSGYRFRVWLPDAAGDGVPEAGYAPHPVRPRAAGES